MKSALQFLEYLRMGQVTRYHTRPFIRPQTTGDHSGRVALLLTLFWPGCTVTALKAALYHDLSEHFTGDIPAPVKWQYPALGAAISAIEGQLDEKFGLTTGMLSPREFWWVKWCDYFEGTCKCLEELAMGNLLAGPPFDKWLPILQKHLEHYVSQMSVIAILADDNSAVAMMESDTPTATLYAEMGQLAHVITELEHARAHLTTVAELYQ